jgi:cytoskeleton protein RodZ
MGSFGENLRRERQMRSVTLEEISDATKISLRALEALEAEDFLKLPGGVFNRSFVRTYARYLGLDEEKILAEFQAVCPKGEDVDLKQFNPIKPAKTAKEAPLGRLVILTLALTLLAGGYVFYIVSRRRLAAIAPKPTVAADARSGESKDSDGTSAMAASEGASHGPSTNKRPASHAGDARGQGTDMVLQVAATEEAWVAVEADGKPAFQRLLNPHDIQTVRATTSFDLITGNAQGVILTLNGETLKPLGQQGEVKKLHLTRDNLKNAAP